jgi:REP element-mobilizing transposase RayT
MTRQRHFYGLNHLHYLTTSTYRRARLFDSERFKRNFITVLGGLRAELGFRIVGHVLMPEHFHLLIWPGSRQSRRPMRRSAWGSEGAQRRSAGAM